MWDVFISHAWEDKEEVARPLAELLQKQGLRVWYDDMTLTLGDSLRRSIDRGLAESRYGVVILSPAFLAKDWTQYELDGLVTRDVASKVILPVWHHLSRDQVARYSPPLAGKVAVSTREGLDQVVRAIMAVVRPDSAPTNFGNPYLSGDTNQNVQSSVPAVNDPRRLADLLYTHFSLEELNDLCWRLGVETEDLGGGTKQAKVRELISYLQRRGKLSELVALTAQLRPNAVWS